VKRPTAGCLRKCLDTEYAQVKSEQHQVCRYVARPPPALERLSRDGDGLVVRALKRTFREGTTEFLLEPLDFLTRLAALVPRPQSHLTRYHGILAPNVRYRRLAVPAPPPALLGGDIHPEPSPGRAPMNWMQRLRRVFDIDLSHGPLAHHRPLTGLEPIAHVSASPRQR